MHLDFVSDVVCPLCVIGFGRLHAVGAGWITWGVESFVDALAIKQNKYPLQYRLDLLDGKGRNGQRHV